MASVNRGRRLKALALDVYREHLKRQLLRHVFVLPDGCWQWNATKTNSGYGSTRLLGITTTAHRASYFAFLGAIPEGMEICHRCDVRSCINPEHLFVATHAENMTDLSRKGRGRNGVMSGAYRPEHGADGRFMKLNKEHA